jgi:hypothetical protein
MTTATLLPTTATRGQTPDRMCQLLSRDQYFALARLEGLLQHRDAVDAGCLSAGDQPWLVHALDAAIVSYYRLACELGVQTDAGTLLSAYRSTGLG